MTREEEIISNQSDSILALSVEIEKLHKEIDDFESRTCENCRYCDEFRDDILHCNYFEQFFPTEIGKCDKWENR